MNRTWVPLNPHNEDALSHFMSLAVDPKMKHNFSATAGRLWNWMIPRILDPALATTSQNPALIFSNDIHINVVSKKLNVYKTVTFVLLAVVIVIILVYIVSFMMYRRKMRTYQFLRKIEELNFT